MRPALSCTLMCFDIVRETLYKSILGNLALVKSTTYSQFGLPKGFMQTILSWLANRLSISKAHCSSSSSVVASNIKASMRSKSEELFSTWRA